MKHYKEFVVPEHIEGKLEKITCDLCGVEIRDASGRVDEVNLGRRIGWAYPEGGSGKKIEIDMCPKCFDEKLLPWLKSQGVKVVEVEWEF